MTMDNITLHITSPPGEKLCFDNTIFPFVFPIEKFKKEHENIIQNKQTSISLNFRLLLYLLSRNRYLFEVEHIQKELILKSDNLDADSLIHDIFEDKLEEAIQNLDEYLKELILEGYLSYIFVRDN